MQNKVILILSGYNQRGIISFIRVLDRNNVQFKIVTLDGNDPINNSNYSSHILSQRKSTELTLELFEDIAKLLFHQIGYSNAVILPSAEYLNRFLLVNREKLEDLNFEIPLVNESLYNDISDKYSFAKICESAGINVPKEYPHYPSLPFVAKPKCYFSEDRKALFPFIIESKKQLQNFDNKKNKSDYFYQQFIGGDSIYLLYYFSKSGSVTKYSQKNLMQQCGGKSIIAARSGKYHEEIISDKFINILKELEYFGPIMVEIKFFNEKYYLIETNPRIWGPSQLFVDANIPIFENFIIDLGFEIKNENEKYKETFYFWFGGMFPSGNKNPIVFHNYSWQEFYMDFPKLVANEIYRHDDTRKIFIKEISE